MYGDDKKMAEGLAHLEGHINYPASKDDITKACNNMSDVPEEDKKWFMENLPQGTYQSADEVKAAVGIGMEGGMGAAA